MTNHSQPPRKPAMTAMTAMKPELIAICDGKAEYRLYANQPLRIVHAAGRQIECLRGTAWITAYGEHTDFMLRQGLCFEVPNDGVILIDAAGSEEVRVRFALETRRPNSWNAWQRKMAIVLSGFV